MHHPRHCSTYHAYSPLAFLSFSCHAPCSAVSSGLCHAMLGSAMHIQAMRSFDAPRAYTPWPIAACPRIEEVC